jgi:hypothetical protein
MKQFLFCLIISIFSISCATNKPITSTAKPSQMKGIAVLRPQSYLKVISLKDDKNTSTDGLNTKTSEIVKLTIEDFSKNHKKEFTELSLTNSELNFINQEINGFIYKMTYSNSATGFRKNNKNFNFPDNQDIFKSMKVSNGLVEILKKKKVNYLMSVVNVGFSRNYNSEVINTVSAVSGLTTLAALGFGVFYYEVPHNLTTFLIIIDTDKKSLALFHKKTEDVDPNNAEFLKKQNNQILEDYWIWHDSVVK